MHPLKSDQAETSFLNHQQKLSLKDHKSDQILQTISKVKRPMFNNHYASLTLLQALFEFDASHQTLLSVNQI